MNEPSNSKEFGKRRVLLPAVLRISVRVMVFIFWTTLAGAAFAQTHERRVVKEYPVGRAAIENLQLWVDAGHDTWCRNPEFVAAAALRRIAPEMGDEYELASTPHEKEKENGTRALYTYHSLDGRTTYRITVRRYRWLKAPAGTVRNAVWVPECTEIISKQISD